MDTIAKHQHDWSELARIGAELDERALNEIRDGLDLVSDALEVLSRGGSVVSWVATHSGELEIEGAAPSTESDAWALLVSWVDLELDVARDKADDILWSRWPDAEEREANVRVEIEAASSTLERIAPRQ